MLKELAVTRGCLHRWRAAPDSWHAFVIPDADMSHPSDAPRPMLGMTLGSRPQTRRTVLPRSPIPSWHTPGGASGR